MSLTGKSMEWKKLASTFRKKFVFPTNASANWFPGHMTKGLKMMERTLLETDLVSCLNANEHVKFHPLRLNYT